MIIFLPVNELCFTIVFLLVIFMICIRIFLNHIYYLTNIQSHLVVNVFFLMSFNTKNSRVNKFYKISMWICILIIEIWKITIYVMITWFSVMPRFIAILLVTLGFTPLPFGCLIVSELCLEIYFYIDYLNFSYFFYLLLLSFILPFSGLPVSFFLPVLIVHNFQWKVCCQNLLPLSVNGCSWEPALPSLI